MRDLSVFSGGGRARGDSAGTLGGFTVELGLVLGSAEPGPAVTSSHQDCPQCATRGQIYAWLTFPENPTAEQGSRDENDSTLH